MSYKKGRRKEYHVLAQIQRVFPSAYRVPLSGAHRQKGDIVIHNYGITIEVKGWKVYPKLKKEILSWADALVYKKNGHYYIVNKTFREVLLKEFCSWPQDKALAWLRDRLTEEEKIERYKWYQRALDKVTNRIHNELGQKGIYIDRSTLREEIEFATTFRLEALLMKREHSFKQLEQWMYYTAWKKLKKTLEIWLNTYYIESSKEGWADARILRSNGYNPFLCDSSPDGGDRQC